MIYKITNLKVNSKGRYFVLKKSPFKNYNERSFGLQRCFPVFAISQSGLLEYHLNKPRLRKFEWLAGGENTWLSSARFKIETRCGCFNITVFLKETACLQKILDVIFISSYIYAFSRHFYPKRLIVFTQAIHLFWSVCVFPGNWTHKLLRC